ncbi:MAG: ABC transporter permease [Verrucomicrobiota bacterium]
MNLILHQFKTDWRHVRLTAAGLWLLFGAELAVMLSDRLGYETRAALQTISFLGQLFIAFFLITTVVQADPLVGTSAAWLTRPVRRRHLFWAKGLFLVVCVLLPKVLLVGVGWVLRGYSSALWLCAAGQTLLFSGTFVLLVAVLSSLTRNLARLFLGLGIGIAGMFAWAVTLEMLKNAQILRRAGAGGFERTSFDASQLTAMFVTLLVCLLAAWIAQVWFRRARVGIICLTIGLMLFPLLGITWPFNFLRPRLPEAAPMTLNLWKTNRPALEPGQQLIAAELILNGVPSRQVAALQYCNATVRIPRDVRIKGQPNTYWPSPRINMSNTRLRPAESSQAADYVRLVKGYFSARTLWFDQNYWNGVGSALYDESLMKRFTNRPPAAVVTGSLEADLFGVDKAAEVSLQPQTLPLGGGRRVTIHAVSLQQDSIKVQLSETTPSLLFDHDPNHEIGQNYQYTACTYVLFHPRYQEAFLLRTEDVRPAFPGILSGEWQVFAKARIPYPALRERLAGVSAAEWLKEARLCVFNPVYAGTARLNFADNHYTWPNLNGVSRRESAKQAGMKVIENLQLPADATDTQFNTYLDEIFANVPDNLPYEESQLLSRKLSALGTNGVPALLRRLPLPSHVEHSVVLTVLEKLVNRSHLPELEQALQRDSNVVRLYLQKRWQADARPIVLAKLARPQPVLSSEELRLAAEAHDPATYANLRRHFLALNYGHDHVLPALAQCPGLDVDGLVRDAWKRARLGLISDNDLALPAAKLGLPGALPEAVIQVETYGDSTRRKNESSQLAALTGYTGDANKTLDWISDRLDRLAFDAAQGRYVLDER